MLMRESEPGTVTKNNREGVQFLADGEGLVCLTY